MKYTTRDIQARCHAFGIDAGPIDGVWGSKTQEGARALMKMKGVSRIEDAFHRSGLHRIHMHWSAGTHTVGSLEKKHYHFIVDKDGRVHDGDLKPEANASTSDGNYAAHTRAANSGAIGVSVAAMAFAKESPFDPGDYPITEAQIRGFAEMIADLSDTYDIPVSKYSILNHSEVGPVLGIRQRGKWDINWIPGMNKPGRPTEVGDKIRDMIRDYK